MRHVYKENSRVSSRDLSLVISFLYSRGLSGGRHNSSYRSIAYAERRAEEAAVHRAYPAAPVVSNSGNSRNLPHFQICMHARTHAHAARYTHGQAFIYRHTPEMQII